jgi:hypothetical protein
MNGAYEVLVYANNVNLWAEKTFALCKKITKLYTSRSVVLLYHNTQNT